MIRTLVKIFQLVKDFKRYFYIAFLFVALIEISNLVGQYLFKDVIDLMVKIHDPGNLNTLIYLCAGMISIYFLTSLFEYINGYVTVQAQVKMENYITLLVFKKLMNLSLAYHEKENTGAKLSKINRGVDNIGITIENIFWNLAPTLIRLIASFGFLYYIDYRMGLSFLIIIPLFFWLTFRLNKKAYPIRQKIWRGYEKVYGNFGQAIYNVKTVQAFAQEDREKNLAEKGVWDIIKTQVGYFKLLFSYSFLRNNVITLGNIIMISLGVYLAYNQQITPGGLVMFLTVSNQSYYSLFSLTRVYDRLMEAKTGIDRIMKVLDSDQEIHQNTASLKMDLRGGIEFKNVSFDYGEGNVLKNISFKIKPGETVALVGPSGGGKTTIAKLIYRYFDATKGKILIDNIDIRDLDIKDYRGQLGVVNQDIDIFNSSVKENIAYGKPNAKLSEIKRVAELCNAAEFIDKLKKKYNTIVGERGVKLSGGQKQRIGIARAILVDPKILVLDEATSSLDAGSEQMIQEAVENVKKNRTTIIIAHRLSTIKTADRIIVIDNGKLVEIGTHEYLLRKDGTYARLIKLQIGGYLS